MEGHFLVCENAEEEFDISFQVNSTMDTVIPKDQQELYVKAESACNIIKALENTDKQTKKKYFDKLLSLSQVGLVANPAQTETAEFALMKLKDEMSSSSWSRPPCFSDFRYSLSRMLEYSTPSCILSSSTMESSSK